MRIFGHLVFVLVLSGSLGCMGRISPQTIQAGSTIVVPLNSQHAAGPVGFGGTDIADPQRGELIYLLDTPTGPFELTTRGSTLVTGHAGSSSARGGTPTNQIFSVVDVPSDAPLGTFPVDVFWRRTDPATGNLVETELDHGDEISVLPNQISVDGPNGSETITGTPTPFEGGSCDENDVCTWDPVNVSTVIPDPAFAVTFSTKPWAVELEVLYPEAVIDIVDVYQAPLSAVNNRAVTWFDDDSVGTLSLSAVGTHATVRDFRVGFTLDDPTNVGILDPASVSVNVVRAWDQDGNEISITATVGRVF